MRGDETDRATEFAEFVRGTGTQLHRAALLLTGDHHLAEDLTQATYAKAFAAWRRVSASDNPLAYCRTTLLNTYLSHRRLRRNSERPVDLSTETAHTGSPAPPEDSDLRVDLLAALAVLPALDRAVVVLRYWEDRSVADTALDLGLTPTAVRSRAHRALERLRPLLDAPELSERTPS